jgi:cytochrome c2
VVVAAGLAGCQGGRTETDGVVVLGGDRERGAAVIQEAGCGTCHTIPGVAGASGTVGPPLTAWARRSYIAGNLPNAPDNLIRWVMDPHAVEPGTAMPDLGVSEQQARDVAAYLYTLK